MFLSIVFALAMSCCFLFVFYVFNAFYVFYVFYVFYLFYDYYITVQHFGQPCCFKMRSINKFGLDRILSDCPVTLNRHDQKRSQSRGGGRSYITAQQLQLKFSIFIQAKREDFTAAPVTKNAAVCSRQGILIFAGPYSYKSYNFWT